MSDTTPRLQLPFLAAAQAQKHVTLNEALLRLDVLVQAAVQSRTVAAEPTSPVEGQAWIIPTGATGSTWGSLHAGDLAAWRDGAWIVIIPAAGTTVWCLAETTLLVANGAGGWAAPPQPSVLSDLARLGVGTGADAANPFAAKLNAALFSARTAAEGGDGSVRVKLNKATSAAVGSLVWQDNYAGRAELGLVGDDQLRLKLSADGSVWTEALVARADGGVELPQGLASVAGGPTAGLRNRLHNGDFRVRQRGDGPVGAGVLMDRWRLVIVGAASAQQQAGTSVGAPGGLGTLALQVNSISAGQEVIVRQQIDEFADLAGRRVSLSGWLKGPAGVSTKQGVNDQLVLLTHDGSWRFFQVVRDLPADLNSLYVDVLRFPSATGAFQACGIQLEIGPLATPFEARPRALEVAICRRYFRRYATARSAADLAYVMRATPTASGAGPYDYAAEL